MAKTTKTTTTKTAAKTDETAAAKKTEKTQAGKSMIAKSTRVEITLSWSNVGPLYTKNLNKLGRNVKAEGFRVGKAPAAIVEAKVGFERIADQVLQELLPAAYEAAVKQSGHKPITTPEFNPVKLNKGEDWVLEALFDLMPEVKLSDYRKLAKTAKKTAADFIEQRNAEIAKEAEAHEKGEHSNEDGHTHTHQPLSENEEKEIKLQHIFKALVDASAPAIGEIMLRQETQSEYERLVNQLKQYGMSAEDYLKRRDISIEQLSQELAGSVLSRLQLDFILAAISQAEKLDVTDQEIEAEMLKITNLKMREELQKNQNYRNQIKANLLQQKTLDLLLQA
jgi:FKBP-type peptidyl-prolyl cis-trans isomerase (trigger factor)